MLVARRSRPTLVTRGSCATLNSGPPPRSLRCVMSPIRRSASTLIERSFGIAKVVPLRPTRRWRKITGPRSSTLMATAPIIMIGAVTTSTRAASVTSSSRLTNRWKPRSRGTSRQSSVSCPIGAGADLTMVDAAQPGVHAHVGARSPEREELGVGGLAPERVGRRDDDRRAAWSTPSARDRRCAPMWATPRPAASGAQAPTQPRIIQPASACSVIRSRTSVASLPSASTMTRSTYDQRSRSRSSIRSTTKRPACTAPVASAVASTELPSPRSTVWSRMMTAAPLSSVARITMRCSKTRPTPALHEYPRWSTVRITTAPPMPAAITTAVAVVTAVVERTSSQAAPLVAQSVSARVVASEVRPEFRPEFAMGRVKPTLLTPS